LAERQTPEFNAARAYKLGNDRIGASAAGGVDGDVAIPSWVGFTWR
jgi:hypothetical protein